MMTQAIGAGVKQNGRKPWLLIFNCQAIGLANCLNLLCPDIYVEAHAYSPSKLAGLKELIARNPYERILTLPQMEQTFGTDLACQGKAWPIPSVLFHGYHPDFCHLHANGALLKGPLEGLHSVIAFAAFRCGLSEKQALSLYREDIYRHLGYLDGWDEERGRFIDLYKKYGFDVERYFIGWTRSGAFMHSISHPKIFVLRDLAKLIIGHTGSRLYETDMLPHDNLANGPVYPIYPEIGSRLGVQGGYLFKPGGSYECLPLQEIVHRSFEIYRAHPDIKANPAYENRLSLATSVIEASK